MKRKVQATNVCSHHMGDFPISFKVWEKKERTMHLYGSKPHSGLTVFSDVETCVYIPAKLAKKFMKRFETQTKGGFDVWVEDKDGKTIAVSL